MNHGTRLKGTCMRKAMLAVCGGALAMAGLCGVLAHPLDTAAAASGGASAASATGLVAATGTPVDSGSVVVQGAASDPTWYVGQSSPYTVSNVKELIELSNLVNSGKESFEGKVVQLPAAVGSLAFIGTSIAPIGTADHPFEGTFDGNGWSISNLTLDAGNSLSNVGLFGYAGDHATIKNVRLANGAVSVSNTKTGKRISNVGAIAGHLGGSIQNCYSSASVSVVNDGALPTEKGTDVEGMTVILGVGGLVGSLGGDMTGCVNAGNVSVASKSNVTDEVPYIAGYVGGLAGVQGSFDDDATSVIRTADCTNTGAIAFNVTGSGGVDRFGQQMYSKSTMVGGIVGYSLASFSDCKNTGAVHTGVREDGVTQAGWGASNVGGIVGSLRGPGVAESQSATGVVGSNESDPGYDVWLKSKGTAEPEHLQVVRCTNAATVTGLASIGGIAGSTGAFTEIIGCANEGLIEGTRWNKPCPAGIVGISNGDIGYCYNRGRCISTTGGGYYAAGITSLLTTYNTPSTANELVMDVPQIYGCYVTGSIGGKDEGYRTAVLAGENDGYIHDNCFTPNLTVDKVVDRDLFGDDAYHSRLVSAGQDRGVLSNNHELSVADMKSSLAVSYLNKPYAQKSDWSLYYAPQAGAFPILNWQGTTTSSPQALSSVATGVQAVENPAYRASFAPIPAVTLATKGVQLYQDADYRVVVNPDARAVGGSYTATIEGINGYAGTLGAQASYSIARASIDTCTVLAETAVFDWTQQSPKSVTVLDDAGNVVDPAEYTYRTLANDDGSTKAVNGKYYDYINCHGESYKYDIEVTANPSSVNFTGSTTQAAFRISWASLMYSPDNDTRTDIPESAKLGNVVYGNQEWDIAKALKTKGFVKIKYTGSEIKPRFKSVTYKGRDLRDGTGKPYYYKPLEYDFLYVYGNPNPEPGSEADNQCTNVTGSKETQLGCVTARFTTGGNFDNYTNMFYEITPADIATDVAVSGIAKTRAYTGDPLTVSPVLTYNGMTLQEGTDYTLSYQDNTKVGTATVTITGKGNYAGSTTRTFTIQRADLSQASVSAANQVYTGAAIAPKTVVKLNGKTLKAKTDYAVSVSDASGRALAADDVKAAGSYTITITGTGGYTGSAIGQFTVSPANLAVASVQASATFTGKPLAPSVSLGAVKLKKGVDYTVSFKNAAGKAIAASQVKGVGAYTVTVKGKGSCTGGVTKAFKVMKAANPVTASAKGLSTTAKALKAGGVTFKAITVKAAKGTVSYQRQSGPKNLSVNAKTGKVTLAKGTRAGTYTMKVKVTAAGNANYKKGSVVVPISVKVK